MNWQPGASFDVLRARAALLDKIRLFFAQCDVLEVDTPLLCSAGITDPSIEPLVVEKGASLTGDRFLQTSPEYAMKRLLAAGSGPIYQISKAFRDGEFGARHNPEFTLLEWYRPQYDHHQLMTEVAALVCHCLGPRDWQKISYRELFQQTLDIDPFTASPAHLCDIAKQSIELGFASGDRDLWLDLLMSHLVEPELAKMGMCFVYDYPASQAALSRVVRCGDVDVGQRFELYVDGMELVNGYCELTDAVEQKQRFMADNEKRRETGLAERPVDASLLEAMCHGLPECSGVALGVDRLLMLLTGSEDIRDVLAFDWARS
ncbi:MAG: EF-P lysine aminoacylase GenX [Proteobacteria bacterium]|nr:EF-P lysine aminoacylase GenX [Pseudomonadota bacterium]